MKHIWNSNFECLTYVNVFNRQKIFEEGKARLYGSSIVVIFVFRNVCYFFHKLLPSLFLFYPSGKYFLRLCTLQLFFCVQFIFKIFCSFLVQCMSFLYCLNFLHPKLVFKIRCTLRIFSFCQSAPKPSISLLLICFFHRVQIQLKRARCNKKIILFHLNLSYSLTTFFGRPFLFYFGISCIIIFSSSGYTGSSKIGRFFTRSP